MGGWVGTTLADNADDKEHALGQTEQALAVHHAMGALTDVPYYQVLLADVNRQLGRFDKAEELLEGEKHARLSRCGRPYKLK